MTKPFAKNSRGAAACLCPCGLHTCGVVLQKREERKRGRREQSQADQGGVEPPHKAVKASQGFAKSYATSNGQLVLYYFAALHDATLHPLWPVRYSCYFCHSASLASDTTAATTAAPSAAATTATAGTVAGAAATFVTLMIATALSGARFSSVNSHWGFQSGHTIRSMQLDSELGSEDNFMTCYF